MWHERAVNLALKGRGDGSDGACEERFPWFGVEPAEVLISELLRDAGVLRSDLFVFEDDSERRITALLGGWSNEKLKALTTGHRTLIVGDRIAEPLYIGPVIPPWEKTELTPERVILECLRMLASPDFMAEVPAECPDHPLPLAKLAAHRSDLFIETPWPKNGRCGREETEKTWRSSLLAKNSSLKELAWSWRAYETWRKVVELSVAYIRENAKVAIEISVALAKVSEQRAPSRSWIKNFLFQVGPLLENENSYYKRVWNKSWGPKKFLFLELLRSARRGGVTIEKIKEECGGDPSRMVSELIRNKRMPQKKVGKLLRRLHQGDRYYLFPE